MPRPRFVRFFSMTLLQGRGAGCGGGGGDVGDESQGRSAYARVCRGGIRAHEAAGKRAVRGRSLHSSAPQLNLSRFLHTIHPRHPLNPP